MVHKNEELAQNQRLTLDDAENLA